jgi:hypothetical protein
VPASEAVGCGFDPRRVQFLESLNFWLIFGVAETLRVITLRNLSFAKAIKSSKPTVMTTIPKNPFARVAQR